MTVYGSHVHVRYAVPFNYCSNCMTFLEFLILISLSIASCICLKDSILKFKQCPWMMRWIKTSDSLFKIIWAAPDETDSKTSVSYTTSGNNTYRKVEANPHMLNREISMAYSRQFEPRHEKKTTKWVCAQQRLRSVWASAQSDQSLRCALNV